MKATSLKLEEFYFILLIKPTLILVKSDFPLLWSISTSGASGLHLHLHVRRSDVLRNQVNGVLRHYCQKDLHLSYSGLHQGQLRRSEECD